MCTGGVPCVQGDAECSGKCRGGHATCIGEGYALCIEEKVFLRLVARNCGWALVGGADTLQPSCASYQQIQGKWMGSEHSLELP